MKNITDYFSNSEKETPDKLNRKSSTEIPVSGPNAIQVKNCKSNQKFKSNIESFRGHNESKEKENVLVLSDTDTINVEQINNSSDKKNAFQIMMESRNKSIGTNSPGKDLDNTDNSLYNDKSNKLSVRKKLLNDWADHKGAAKRKREEAEKDKIIKVKLEKRSKRMKKLLNVNVNSNDSSTDSTDIIIKKRKRKKIRKLSCSSNSSIEFTEKSRKHISENENVKKSKSSKTTKKNDKMLLKNGETKHNFHEIGNKSINTTDLNVKSQVQKLNGNINIDDQKNKDINNQNSVVDDSSQDNFNTPSALRSWRLRIKLNISDDKKIIKDHDLINSDGSSLYSPSSDSEYGDDKTAAITKSRKIAPVFIKATPKPKVDPEVLKARQEFLMSGTPDVLKIKVMKQKSVEEKLYDVFPSISHVQQKCENPFWNLPKQDFNEQYSPYKVSFIPCNNLIDKNQLTKEVIALEKPKPIDDVKAIIREIKNKTPDYPVYKSFRLIFEKSGTKLMQKKNEETSVKKRKRGRPKKLEIQNSEDLKIQSGDDAMWTEKYKPKSSEDIIGNADAITKLMKWLKSWKSFSQEIISKKHRRNSSSSEFETTDCDSRDSTRLPSSTIILGGPYGSGKSTAVYAICNELGFNVIEINASSKRTGKKLLQELQEATQSYQVKKGEKGIQNLFSSNKEKDKPSSEDCKSDKKMSVILVEDVDIVFDQDDGFIMALQQLVVTSKRPIILTTNDYSSNSVQKFLSEYDCVSFSRLQSSSLATWCQILCLLEGLYIDRDDIANLIDYNKGDMRKTLLQLQYWVQSGGQLIQNDMIVRIQHEKEVCDEKLFDDEQLESFTEDTQIKNESIVLHRNCFRSFEIFMHSQDFSIPYYLNLGFLWWNVPNLFGLKDFSKRRINNLKLNDKIEVDDEKDNCQDTRGMKKLKLGHMSNFYLSISLADVLFRKCNYINSFEPEIKNHTSNFKDSLELSEKFNTFDDMEFVHHLTHTLVDGYVKQFKTDSNNEVKLNVGVPGKSEIRWRTKHHVCEDLFRESLSTCNYVDRKAAALDYYPSLRNISRSETQRAANNTKRGNRFRNYLRDLGVRCSENNVKLACKMLWEAD